MVNMKKNIAEYVNYVVEGKDIHPPYGYTKEST